MTRKLSAALLRGARTQSDSPDHNNRAVAAQTGFAFSFDYFYDQLSPYGQWSYHPRWGDVWRPTRVGADFRPYYRGYWVNTVEYGWTWNSDDPWGDIPYHYGRWVYDPYDGWLWVPGFVWGPSWVVWEAGPDNSVGWFPMPPDDDFILGEEIYRTDWDWRRDYFGYANWYGPSIASTLLTAWVFVDLARFPYPDYYRYAYPPTRIVNIINNTTNITNYVVINNRIVNRSIDLRTVERVTDAGSNPFPRARLSRCRSCRSMPVDKCRCANANASEGTPGHPQRHAQDRWRPRKPGLWQDRSVESRASISKAPNRNQVGSTAPMRSSSDALSGNSRQAPIAGLVRLM
jgi:hypothetical protein